MIKAKFINENMADLNRNNLLDLIGDSYFYFGDAYEVIPPETIDYIKAKHIRYDNDLVIVFSYGSDNWNEILRGIQRSGIPYHIAPDEGGEEGESILIFNKKDLENMSESKNNKNMKARLIKEGFATEEGRKLDRIASLLGYDDLHEMLGDNPGLYEACIEWIEMTFSDQLGSQGFNPEELERLDLYQAADMARDYEEPEDDMDEGMYESLNEAFGKTLTMEEVEDRFERGNRDIERKIEKIKRQLAYYEGKIEDSVSSVYELADLLNSLDLGMNNWYWVEPHSSGNAKIAVRVDAKGMSPDDKEQLKEDLMQIIDTVNSSLQGIMIQDTERGYLFDNDDEFMFWVV